ncbi:hypothetical protein [Iodobacter ciconiae]|uniref:Immunity protein 43 domain-containing protein n=1 Tax=Iodobacter ciconiae TaxID=2496266 RepID=A0A3S8ZPU3_9NEIS|nr:hypothetical protein [Iodobacter ciconiae]AZN35501.1 hypothetical protein EJO50_02760 [Iodobacter ciconiae]
MKKYFALARKNQIGCPVGYINWVLYDKYYPLKEAKKIQHGYYPWYAENRESKIDNFPENIHLIYNGGEVDFDIRAEPGNYFIVISKNALEVINKFSIQFDDIREVVICDANGQKTSNKEYCVARLTPITAEEVDSGSSEFIKNEYGRITKIRKISFSPQFDCDLFRIKGMLGGSQTLICSEELKNELELANADNGINFVDLSSFSCSTFWNFEAI